ncbi:CD5 protein, partial [Podargus strigoides]|nr:CD5 protein [Podargus strigoides]
LQLTGGGCRCAGMLEVRWEGRWSRVCQGSVIQAGADGACRQLGCGPPSPEPLQLIHTHKKEPRASPLKCLGTVATLARCRWMPANCTEYATLACSGEPRPPSLPPPSLGDLVKELLSPPHPSPGPPRLRLVDGDFACSGFVELQREGLWGAVAGSSAITPELATHICHQLQCGSAIHGHAEPERGSHLPVRWEAVEPCGSRSLFDCFNRTSARRGRAPAFITCSGSQPQALRRLAGGPTPCEGDMEVFHEGRWRVLCDDRARRVKWGRQLCWELRCGNLSSSSEIRDPPSMGVPCSVPYLHLWSGPVTPILSPGQDSKPPPTGTAAGTIVSICLALLLFGVLLLICGPPAYRRLMKRISKKKQRQWIGPTGLSQTVSFHRNSTVTPRPWAEGQRAQGGDNDYAQPPQKSSHLSAYPALEGACRASNPPDNSSDSDYDLHSARRV